MLYVEAKQYGENFSRTKITEAYKQVWGTWATLRQQYNIPEAFLLVFRVAGPASRGEANRIVWLKLVHTKLSHATTREQDLGSGKKGQSVFFDSERPERNDFVVTRQYRLQGVKKQIVPDIVLFVNGIPLAVIECKSPTLGEKWRQEAIEQLLRYQEISDDYVELGMPRLFETVQLVATVCGQAACCWDAQRLPKMC